MSSVEKVDLLLSDPDEEVTVEEQMEVCEICKNDNQSWDLCFYACFA